MSQTHTQLTITLLFKKTNIPNACRPFKKKKNIYILLTNADQNIKPLTNLLPIINNKQITHKQSNKLTKRA